MKIITTGAEHHFLSFLEQLKNNPNGWVACTVGFSRLLVHEQLMARRAFIAQELEKQRALSSEFLKQITPLLEDLPQIHAFQFCDNDLVFLCCPQDQAQHIQIRNVFEEICAKTTKSLCDYGFLTKELHVFQKIADSKLLSMKKMEAYRQMSIGSSVKTIGLRRKKRDEPLILVVDDDRFTANYLHSFLKDYDVVIARNGEDAIMKYIEYAPDMVFLDVILPGLDGHEVLSAIKTADPNAFVVMLSVDTARGKIMQASLGGAASYLKKPFSRSRVLNSLRLSPYMQRFMNHVTPLREGGWR